MSPRERRAHRGILNAAAEALADLPIVLARLVPRRATGDSRRRRREWTRPRRIAVALVVLAAAAASILVLSRFRDRAAAARLRPEDKVARFDAGVDLIRLGRTDEGMREVRAAALLDVNFDDAHFVLAQHAAARGDENEAFAELRLVVANPPTSGAAASMLASILLRRGRAAEAMAQLQASVADATADPVVRIRDGLTLGRMHGVRSFVQRVAAREKRLESGCYAVARQTADEALARAAGDVDAPVAAIRKARAEALLAAGRAAEALVDADLAFGGATDAEVRSEIRLLRAQIYSSLEDAAAADREFAAALADEAKPSAAAFRAAAGTHLARGGVARALEILAAGTKVHPEDVALGLDRADALFASGAAADVDAAEAECARLAAADKKGTGALVLAGDIRRARDDLEGARKAYAEASARDPRDDHVRLRVAGTAIAESGRVAPDAEERLAEAERIAVEILAVSPKSPGALLALAKVRLARSPGRDAPGRADAGNAEARRLLVEAVDGDPLSIEARAFLGYSLHLTRNDEEAAVELKQVLAAVPGARPRIRLLLARCLYEARAYPAASEEAARAVEGLPDDPAAWTVRAAAAREAADVETALDALRRLDALDPKDLMHLFQQAALLGKSGRFAAAQERFAVAEERVRAIVDDAERADAEMLVAEARSSFHSLRGDVERARGALGATADKGPTTAAPFVAFARFLLRMGRKDEAERQIECGLAAEPTSLDARRLQCEIEFSRRHASPLLLTQIQEVERAAATRADAAKLVDYLRGRLATLQGDLRVARERLTRYVETAPDDPDGLFALGAALAAAGEYAEAVRRLESAGALLPGGGEVRVALAKTRQAWALEMMRRGRTIEAQATLRSATSDDPPSREVQALFADSLQFTGDVELSEKEVRALLRADPADRAALRMLCAIEVQKGRLDVAATTLRELVRLSPDDWNAWGFLSAVLADSGDLDAAETAAKASRAAAPDEPGALAAVLHVLTERKNFAAAEKEIEAAATKRPDEAQYPCFLAMLRAQQGRHEDAVAAAAKALDLRPATPVALQIAIHALTNGLDDPERASAFARERSAKAKGDSVMTYLAAKLESDLGRRAEALALLEPVCAAETPPTFALSFRGMLLLDGADFAGARAALKKGLDVHPASADLHFLLARSRLADPSGFKSGEIEEAARGFAVAELRAALRSSRSHAPAMNDLAWLLSSDEATRAEALQLAESAVQTRPGHAPYLDTLATVLTRIGRTDEAVAVLRSALVACDVERVRIDQATAKKPSSIEMRRIDAQRKRLDRVTADVKAHYEAALRASTTR